MRALNLAEARIAERTYCKALLCRQLRTMALLILMTIVVAAFSYGCRRSIGNTQARLKSQLADVQGNCVRIKRDIATVRASSSQRKWQRQLAGQSRRWLGVMDTVLARVPAQVRLNRLESSEQNGAVSVEGRAPSFDALSEFTSSLRASASFPEVRITNTQVTVERGATVVDFALQLKLKAPAGAPAQQPQPAQGIPPVQESG